MKAIGRISNPRIVQAFDAGETDGFAYIAMELIDGVDLRTLVASRGPLPSNEACHLVCQAALALSAAHGAGMVHRDIKPSNLMLTRSGDVKLLDLGLVRLAEEFADDEPLTAAGQWIGTPDYMAPEQWDDPRGADHRTDLYAVGCTLFHLLAGHPPFSNERTTTHSGKMKAHLIDAVPDLRVSRPETPETVVQACERLLAKSPGDRFQSADELIAVLEPFAGNPPAFDDTEVDAGLATVSVTPDVATPIASPRSSDIRKGVVGAVLFLLIGLAALPFVFFRKTPVPLAPGGKKPTTPTDSVPAATSLWSNAFRDRNAAEWVLTQGGKVEAHLEDAGEELLSSLPVPDRRFRVTTVWLARTPKVTDSGLEALKGLPALGLLELNHNADLTDQLFEHLGQLPSLVEINLARTKVTDGCWDWLKEQQALTKIDLWGTQVTGGGLAALEGSRVRWLRLGGTRVDDKAFASLESFPSLHILELTSTGVTPAFLPHLARVAPNLQRLAIDGTMAESEAGIELLAQLSELTTLQVNGSALTPTAQASLRKIPRLTAVGFGYDIPDIDAERFPETVRAIEWLWTETPVARAATELDWRLPQVETVRLSFITSGGRYAGMLECCPNATRVILREAHDFNETDIEALARLPKLKTVKIDRTSPSAYGHLPRLRSLRPDLQFE